MNLFYISADLPLRENERHIRRKQFLVLATTCEQACRRVRAELPQAAIHLAMPADSDLWDIGAYLV